VPPTAGRTPAPRSLMRPVAAQLNTVEKKVGLIAGRAHGVVTRAELREAGVTKDEIEHRLETGSLIAVFRGVYRVGHCAPSAEARYAAAVKACGEGAVLSGLAAAWAWGLIRRRTPPPAEVTCPRSPAPSSISPHCCRSTTSPKRSTKPTSVTAHAQSTSTPSSRATRTSRAPTPSARSQPGDLPTLLSELEKRFRALLEEHGLPLPRTNRERGAHYVDCRWPDHRLTVELDSYRFHRSRHAWEQDRARERAARARGDEFRRYTWRDVVEEPAPTVAELRVLLLA
jgi:hypothetical protein